MSKLNKDCDTAGISHKQKKGYTKQEKPDFYIQ